MTNMYEGLRFRRLSEVYLHGFQNEVFCSTEGSCQICLNLHFLAKRLNSEDEDRRRNEEKEKQCSEVGREFILLMSFGTKSYFEYTCVLPLSPYHVHQSRFEFVRNSIEIL